MFVSYKRLQIFQVFSRCFLHNEQIYRKLAEMFYTDIRCKNIYN